MTGVELRILKWIAEKKLWAKWGRAHAAIYRLTGGRIGHSSGRITNLLLTTTGRRSGQPRTVPLSYIRDGDDIVVVASNGGADRDPVWWLNLSATPTASVQIEGRTFPVQARRANDADCERLWPRLQEENLFYSRHRANTDRSIPIVLLSPQSGTG
jgi:deazaflavin-dependent oxidoreductase (nitroreductase family)